MSSRCLVKHNSSTEVTKKGLWNPTTSRVLPLVLPCPTFLDPGTLPALHPSVSRSRWIFVSMYIQTHRKLHVNPIINFCHFCIHKLSVHEHWPGAEQKTPCWCKSYYLMLSQYIFRTALLSLKYYKYLFILLLRKLDL